MNPLRVFSRLKESEQEVIELRDMLSKCESAKRIHVHALIEQTARAQKAEIALEAALLPADPVAWRSRSLRGSIWHAHIEPPEMSAKAAVIEALYTHSPTKENP